jgi:nitroimidazol reductase NimA-like FMN-containing flavoprotein (pyridoxamine 5'-phosphate oxidase superfamily)
VFFHTASEGRKHDVLKSNSRVCLEFDQMTGVDSNALDTFYTSVIAWGRTRIVDDRNLSRKILALLVEKYIGEVREITDNMVDRTCVSAVELEEITGKENRA